MPLANLQAELERKAWNEAEFEAEKLVFEFSRQIDAYKHNRVIYAPNAPTKVITEGVLIYQALQSLSSALQTAMFTRILEKKVRALVLGAKDV